MKTLILNENGLRVSREKNFLKILNYKNEYQLIPLKDLEQIIISGEISISTNAMEFIISKNIDCVFFKEWRNSKYRLFSDNNMKDIESWNNQINISEMKRYSLACEFLISASYNKLKLLEIYGKDKDLSLELFSLRGFIMDLKRCKDINQLFMIEASITSCYFRALKKIIPEQYKFIGRVRKPTKDIVNSLLSYGYKILEIEIEKSLFRLGLNPYVGILHVNKKNRKSLIYDIIEEFRQPIIDETVIKLCLHKEFLNNDFNFSNKGICHIDGGKKKYLNAIFTKLEQKTKYAESNKTFKEIIFEQASLLKKSINKIYCYKGFHYEGD